MIVERDTVRTILLTDANEVLLFRTHVRARQVDGGFARLRWKSASVYRWHCLRGERKIAGAIRWR